MFSQSEGRKEEEVGPRACTPRLSGDNFLGEWSTMVRDGSEAFDSISQTPKRLACCLVLGSCPLPFKPSDLQLAPQNRTPVASFSASSAAPFGSGVRPAAVVASAALCTVEAAHRRVIHLGSIWGVHTGSLMSSSPTNGATYHAISYHTT